ncbi:DUF2905 domain-containing protein [bacterium]|nr:DUF2905 domain-containing protein [bacterium]MBU1026072.1 DUF2905 domain-containing protein [bacterium]
MDMSKEIGRLLIIAGVFLLLLGGIYYFGSRYNPFGHFPRDIHV